MNLCLKDKCCETFRNTAKFIEKFCAAVFAERETLKERNYGG